VPTQSSTPYIGGVYEQHLGGSVVKYYQAMGRTVAMRTVGAGGGQGTLSYPLTDHLGSTIAMTDDAGAVTGTRAYWPYVATRSSTGVLAAPPATDPLYTG